MDDLWLAVRWLHVLAMAFFVGGQMVLAFVVVPAERGAPDRTRLQAAARRFGYGTLVAIAVLLATGSAMASHYGLWSDGTLQIKLALVAVGGGLGGGDIPPPAMHAPEGGGFVVSPAVVLLRGSLP